MAIATSGLNTIFKVGDGASPEVFTEVALVKSIDGPNPKADTIDVTVLNNSTGTKEFIGGFIDSGEIKLSLVYDPNDATQMGTTGLYGLMYARTVANFKIVMNNISPVKTFSFKGVVVDFGLKFDGGQHKMLEVAIKCSDKAILS